MTTTAKTTTITATPATPRMPAAASRRSPIAWLTLAASLAASLAACGGGGDGAGDRFAIGGTVSGLPASGSSGTATRLVLQNNGGDDLVLAANGRFTFATPLAAGNAYAVRVLSQPAGLACSVANGSGAVAGAAVESVQVACAAAAQALPEGDWTGRYCQPSWPDPSRLVHARIVRQDDTHATVRYGYFAFTSTDCSGRGTLYVGPVVNESFAADRQETRGDLTAFWGNLTSHETTKRAVWARKGPYLCPLQEDTRTQYPTLDSVEQGVQRALQLEQCFVPTP
jgi:hypothetical protein